MVASRRERIFPKLTPDQVNRVAAQGRLRKVQRGELLVEAGAAIMPFFVVKSGEIQIARPTCGSEQMIAVHHPGEFTGEVNMLSSRPSMVRARISEAGELRERYEYYREPFFGVRGIEEDDYLFHRLLFSFDLHVRNSVRVFLQLGNHLGTGKRGARAPTDVKEFGVQQAYVDLTTTLDARSGR